MSGEIRVFSNFNKVLTGTPTHRSCQLRPSPVEKAEKVVKVEKAVGAMDVEILEDETANR